MVTLHFIALSAEPSANKHFPTFSKLYDKTKSLLKEWPVFNFCFGQIPLDSHDHAKPKKILSAKFG